MPRSKTPQRAPLRSKVSRFALPLSRVSFPARGRARPQLYAGVSSGAQRPASPAAALRRTGRGTSPSPLDTRRRARSNQPTTAWNVGSADPRVVGVDRRPPTAQVSAWKPGQAWTPVPAAARAPVMKPATRVAQQPQGAALSAVKRRYEFIKAKEEVGLQMLAPGHRRGESLGGCAFACSRVFNSGNVAGEQASCQTPVPQGRWRPHDARWRTCLPYGRRQQRFPRQVRNRNRIPIRRPGTIKSRSWKQKV